MSCLAISHLYSHLIYHSFIRWNNKQRLAKQWFFFNDTPRSTWRWRSSLFLTSELAFGEVRSRKMSSARKIHYIWNEDTLTKLLSVLQRETWTWSSTWCPLHGPDNLITRQRCCLPVERYENCSSVFLNKPFCHEYNIVKYNKCWPRNV